MSKDYIPSSDAGLITWSENFLNGIQKDKAKLSVSDDNITNLTNLRTDFVNKVTNVSTTKAAYESALQERDAARVELVANLRSQAQLVNATPSVTDADRVGLGLNPRDTTRTPAPRPTTHPIATIDTSERLRHRLDYRDSDTPTSRARPAGYTGCEIWRYTGTPAPTGPEQFQLIATDAVSPYIVEYTGTDAGKTAYYMLRWVNGRGETGPWSATVSATVTG